LTEFIDHKSVHIMPANFCIEVDQNALGLKFIRPTHILWVQLLSQ